MNNRKMINFAKLGQASAIITSLSLPTIIGGITADAMFLFPKFTLPNVIRHTRSTKNTTSTSTSSKSITSPLKIKHSSPTGTPNKNSPLSSSNRRLSTSSTNNDNNDPGDIVTNLFAFLDENND